MFIWIHQFEFIQSIEFQNVYLINCCCEMITWERVYSKNFQKSIESCDDGHVPFFFCFEGVWTSTVLCAVRSLTMERHGRVPSAASRGGPTQNTSRTIPASITWKILAYRVSMSMKRQWSLNAIQNLTPYTSFFLEREHS